MQLKKLFFVSVIVVIAAFIFLNCSFKQKNCLKKLNAARNYQYDIIIVPGIPYNKSNINKVLEGRILWSKYLYDNQITKNIMFSGDATYNPFYESKIMALFAVELGIPDSNVFMELTARHSTENVYYSYKKAKKLGFNKIALATDPFQSKSLKKFIKKRLNDSVGIIPFYYDSLGKMNINLTDYEIVDSLAITSDFKDIKEEPKLKRLRGTLGKEIIY